MRQRLRFLGGLTAIALSIPLLSSPGRQGGMQKAGPLPLPERNRQISVQLKKMGVNRMMTPTNTWLTLSALKMIEKNKGYLNFAYSKVLPNLEHVELPVTILNATGGNAPLTVFFKPPKPGYYVVEVVCEPFGGVFYHMFQSQASYVLNTPVSTQYPNLLLVVELRDTTKYEKLYIGTSHIRKFKYCTVTMMN